MTPLTFCTFKWKPPSGYRTTFTAQHVLILRNMLARHYRGPYRFVCITDDPTGLDDVETIPIWQEWANVESPSGRHNPSCYRRLKLFAPDAHEVLGVPAGSSVVSIDLDMVIVRDITPLFDRPEDFIIWGSTDYPGKQWYNGSLWYLRTGTRTHVYTKFDPRTSPREAYKNGGRGSDQGWMSHILGPPKGSKVPTEATWGQADGVYSYRKDIAQPRKSGALPDAARIVAFHGKVKADSPESQCVPWILEHYK